MMKKWSVLALVGTQALFMVPTWASVSQTHATGNVEFTAVGKPSAVKIHGKGTGLDAALSVDGKNVGGKFQFPVDQFDTGIEMRTRHMKEKYLETSKFPKAELEVTSLTLPETPMKDGFSVKQAPFQGQLTLHGVKRPVQGRFDAATSGGKITGAADFEVKTTEYGIEVPKYLGITVADSVQVHVNFEAPSAQN